MSIALLFVACLVSDPALGDPGTTLLDSAIGRAGVQAFESSLLAADPKLDPATTPFAADEKSTFSYTWIEAGYAMTHLDDLHEDSNAIYVRGSWGFANYFNAIAGYMREETGFDNVTLDTYDIGIGAHFPVLKRLDLVGEADWAYNRVHADSLFSDDTSSGFAFYGGARWMVLDWERGGLELDGGLRWSDIDSLLSDKVNEAFEIGARGHFLDSMSVGLAYAFIGSDRRLFVDFRFSF